MSELKDRVKQATGHAPADDEQSPVTDLALNDQSMAWLQSRATYFTDALPRHIDRAHFMSVARAIMPNLSKCTDYSITSALLACARFGLEPDGRQAAVIPYGDTATFQPMYEGYIELMYRHPRVDSVHFSWIREKDQWDYTPTDPSPRDFFHKPRVDLSDEERGKVVLAYAFAWIDGRRSQVIILNHSQALAIRNKYSKAYAKAERNNKRDSAWHTDFDAMWAKSAVRRLVKVVPTSTELSELIQADDDADDSTSVPSVIRGTVISHDDADTPQPGQQQTPTAWPQAAQPGSGTSESGEAGESA